MAFLFLECLFFLMPKQPHSRLSSWICIFLLGSVPHWVVSTLQFLKVQPCLHFFSIISLFKNWVQDHRHSYLSQRLCSSHPGFSELQTSTFPCSLNTTTPLTQRYTDCTKADQGHVPPFKPLTGLSVPTLPTKDCTLGQNDKTILDDSSFYAIQMHSVLRAKSLPTRCLWSGFCICPVWGQNTHALSFITWALRTVNHSLHCHVKTLELKGVWFLPSQPYRAQRSGGTATLYFGDTAPDCMFSSTTHFQCCPSSQCPWILPLLLFCFSCLLSPIRISGTLRES